VDVELCKFITVLAGGGESSGAHVGSMGGYGVLATACARADFCFLDDANDEEDASMERFLLMVTEPEALALTLVADVDAEYANPEEDMDDLFLRLDRAPVGASSSMGVGGSLSLWRKEKTTNIV
jgi:hypothetical protein